MRYIIVLLVLLLASVAYAASGNRIAVKAPRFDTISTPTKRTCTAGDIRYNTKWVYFCQRSNVWHRYSTASW